MQPFLCFQPVSSGSRQLFDHMQIVASRAEADLLCVLECFLPTDVGVAVKEVIVVMVPIGFCKVVTQLAVADRSCLLAEIGACLIQCHRIEGCQHADVRQNRGIIFTMAVTVRGDIHNQTDVEGGSAIAQGMGIFSHFAAEQLQGIFIHGVDCMESAGTDASAAAFA